MNATAYYSAWFKTGVQPAITQDQVFLTYRNRSKWLRKAWNPEKNEWVEDLTLCTWPYDQIHDTVEDNLYVDTFLTSPATVTLKIGASGKTFDLPAGVGHAEVPMAPGVPKLTLSWEGKVLAEVVGRKLIVDKPTEENSSMGGSQHLLNRTWASGTAVGPAIRVEAESGTVHANASIVKVGAATTVATVASDGSGFTVPVKGLKTATYNVRIVYCNPAETEARLTLIADGASRADKDYPYFIPAFLPPTGKDKFETVSFLWSLYETTTFLKMQWELARTWNGKPNPGQDDRGSVLVDAIELVKVEPFQVPAVKKTVCPALVPIEGGTFTMGGDAGEPDEKPAHKVKVSSFAIGKFEVTNEEFEKFDPAHRDFRTSLSWRNREPVIAVSWVDAAKYCNWLSLQVGLTPVYAEITDEKTKEKRWEINLKADGFRLPTESEWEYVASGRGEGRKYPWGNEAPEPGKHGNFEGRKALEFGKPLRSSEGGGAVVVGSFPAGASRDGVMDMAGNVGEWCSDWYGPYPSEDQTDPCGSTPGNYRSIRGGSWGWYGYSQRATDREFNSQNYPGHAYYGFRVVVSDAGWKKLGKTGGQ